MRIKQLYKISVVAGLLACFLGTMGCGSGQMFPTTHTAGLTADGAQQRGYDTNSDGKDDYYQELDTTGRVIRVGFDSDQNGSVDEQVDLDELDLSECRELYILLDGVPYEMMAEMYAQGHFRLFHRPSRLISCFPSMTDVAFAEIFGLSPVLAYEAGYYDRDNAKLHDGNKVYLSGKNEPWNERLDYRGRLWMDAVAYVWPRWWLSHEMDRILDKYRKSAKQRISCYSVSGTCLGTNEGRDGYTEVLLRAEKLCEAAMLASQGRVKITLFADHGHNLTHGKSIDLKALLERAGFHAATKLTEPNDVVIPEFGLITCASIDTLRPELVSSIVVQIEGINLAMYKNSWDSVVVLNRSGKALVSYRDGRYRYQILHGDPLKLGPVFENLHSAGLLDADGYAADEDIFRATSNHEYPDALARIWRAFHGLVKNVPAVVVTTKDGWYCGKGKFDFFVDVASTHGSLNYANSVTFAMSTAGELPEVLRLTDLRRTLMNLGLKPP